MKAHVWRTYALLWIALACAFVAYQLTLPERDDFGVHFTGEHQFAGTWRVTSVEPDSPAQKAAIRRGDVLTLPSTPIARANILFATPGSHISVEVNGKRVVMTARAMPSVGSVGWSVAPVRFAFLFVAGLLAWRRPENRAVRALVVFLVCYGLAVALNNGNLPSPLLSLIVLQTGSAVLFLSGLAAAAKFASLFPSGIEPPAARVLSNAALAFAALGTAAAIAGSAASRVSLQYGMESRTFVTSFILLGVLVVATLVAAYVQGEPAERHRRRWIFLLLAIGVSGPLADVITAVTFGFNATVDALSLLPLAALAVGLAFVILRHRVIDVGFVLNRAIVYATLSFVIVGIFLALETLVGKYVEERNHAESLAFQLTIALALGFSVRYIHARVDRLVDALLFRSRHEAERAIREFAHDAPYITDRDVLLRRCIEAATLHAGAEHAGVWLRDADGKYRQGAGTFQHPAAVDENDPALLAMRARRVIADLTALRSSLPGLLAFPMIVRGETIGALVCSSRRDAETYDPDARESLLAAAAAVAHGLDGLRVAELERTVERLLAHPGATQGAMGTF